jgi:hypothetical protein
MSSVAVKRPAESPPPISQQVYKTLNLLGDPQISNHTKFITTQKALGLAIEYAVFNEDRAALQKAELDALEGANKRLKQDIGELNGRAKEIKASNQKNFRELDDVKVQNDREAFLNSNPNVNGLDSDAAGILAGVASGVSSGVVSAVVTLSSAALPVVGAAAGLAAGISAAEIAKGINQNKLAETLSKYEKEFFMAHAMGTKREAFEYAKKKIMEN